MFVVMYYNLRSSINRGSKNFRNIDIRPFDFLHPQTPRTLIPFVKHIGSFLEKVPLLMEIAGSLYMKAEK